MEAELGDIVKLLVPNDGSSWNTSNGFYERRTYEVIKIDRGYPCIQGDRIRDSEKIVVPLDEGEYVIVEKNHFLEQEIDFNNKEITYI